MTLTTTVQEWMRNVGSREESVVIARAHVAAETSTDVEAICATISRDVFFGVPTRTRAGNELLPGAVLTTYDEVQGYYSGRAGSYVVVASTQLKTVSTDWYLFNESAASLQGTGEIGGVDATGREFVVNSAVIFPTAPDGIRGEICVTKYPFNDIVTGSVQVPPPPPAGQAHLPVLEMEHCAIFERFITALRRHDPSAIADELADPHTMAVRVDDFDHAPAVHSGSTKSDAVAAFAALTHGAEDITMLTRIATDWYVFCEYLMQLEGGGGRRLALAHPIENGKLTGTFGYGKEES